MCDLCPELSGLQQFDLNKQVEGIFSKFVDDPKVESGVGNGMMRRVLKIQSYLY